MLGFDNEGRLRTFITENSPLFVEGVIEFEFECEYFLSFVQQH